MFGFSSVWENIMYMFPTRYSTNSVPSHRRWLEAGNSGFSVLTKALFSFPVTTCKNLVLMTWLIYCGTD